MSSRYSLPKENELSCRMRQEALASRPEFSEGLHVRLWHALERDAIQRVLSHRRFAASHRAPYWLAGVAAIAASVLCATVIGWRPRDVDLRPQAAAGGAAETHVDIVAGLANDVSDRMSLLVDYAVTSRKWAYLDHDAQVALELLREQFPGDPSPPR